MQPTIWGGASSPEDQPSFSRLRQVVRRLLAAASDVEEAADRERAELLAALLLALLVLGFASGLVQWLLIPGFWPTFAAMLVALAVIGGAYAASRTRHFRKAAWAAALAPIVACAVVIREDPKDAVAGPFMLVGVLLATLFFNARSSLRVALAAFLALALALAPWSEGFELQRAVPLLAFHAIFSPLLLIAAAHRNRVEELRTDKLRQQQLVLHEARQMELLGRLAGGVAHDFNNLLTVVMGNTELLRSGGQDGVKALTDDIFSAVDRGAGMTRQLLATARKQILEPRSVELGRLIQGLHALLGRLIGEQIRLLIEVEEDLPPVLADPSQLEQVVLNLVLNARDAMPEGGTLCLCAGRSAPSEHDPGRGSVFFSVSDTGVGMDTETRRSIFKPFFTTKGPAGHGLGLATVRGIVEQSGGRIEVSSTPQRGSQFTVHLPVAPQDMAQEHHREPLWFGSPRKATILLVEDEALVRRAVELMLKEMGHVVLPVHSGAEALAVFEREAAQVDLLLCDVVLPGLSGLELARELGARKRLLPVLFMSGYADPASEAIVDLPAALLIAKPFAAEELKRKIERVLVSRQPPAATFLQT